MGRLPAVPRTLHVEVLRRRTAIPRPQGRDRGQAGADWNNGGRSRGPLDGACIGTQPPHPHRREASECGRSRRLKPVIVPPMTPATAAAIHILQLGGKNRLAGNRVSVSLLFPPNQPAGTPSFPPEG